MSEALVVGGSILGAYVLRPSAELAWNYLWAPWRDLNEIVSNLAQKDRPQQNVDPEAVNRRFQAVSARLEVLRRLEAELREIQKKVIKAQGGGYRAGLDGRHYFWDEIDKSGFKGLQDMQSFYGQLRDCMDEFDAIEVFKVSSSGALSDSDKERLEQAQKALDQALGLIEGEIDRLVAIKSTSSVQQHRDPPPETSTLQGRLRKTPPWCSAQASPRSATSLTMVFLAAPVMRTVARMLFPSTRQTMICARFSLLSLFITTFMRKHPNVRLRRTGLNLSLSHRAVMHSGLCLAVSREVVNETLIYIYVSWPSMRPPLSAPMNATS
jgi:hypothetical protein